MSSDPGDDTAAFQDLVGSLDQPMFVLTAAAAPAGERSGCLLGFAAQCSIDPPRFLVCVSRANHTFGVAMDADVLVVHVLHPTDHRLAERFGEETGDDVDKFDGLDVVDGPDGTPVLVGVDWFAGRVHERIDCGDHVAVVLDPFGGSAARHREGQLGYQDVKGMEPGHPA